MPKLGIDFGTTNSVAVAYDKKKHLFTYFNFEDGVPSPISSTIEFHDNATIVGSQARDRMARFADVDGYCYERSVKSKIGSDEKLYVFGERKEPEELASIILKNLKDQAINEADALKARVDMNNAVFTVPINFNGKARRTLRKSANDAGIDVISFIHEPFAAIIGSLFTDEKYDTSDSVIERIKKLDNKNFLVFDYGGGTLDITVVRNEKGRLLELGTSELSGQAGDKFDEMIAKYVWNSFINDYSSKYSIEYLESKRKEKWRRLLAIAERCKIELSSKESSDFLLNSVTGINEDIRNTISRNDFENIISIILDATCNKIDEALFSAKMQPQDIDIVLLTGGTCNIPAIQKRIIDKFGSRVKTAKDSALVIAQGAAVIAEMGWLPFLTKDIRIVLSDGSYWPMFESEQPISTEDKSAHNEEVFSCVDQRQKRAKIIIDEGHGQEEGKTLCVLNVPTLGDYRFGDDIEISGDIDKDIVLTIRAHSKMVDDYYVNYSKEKKAEIYQLCFGLDLSERR